MDPTAQVTQSASIEAQAVIPAVGVTAASTPLVLPAAGPAVHPVYGAGLVRRYRRRRPNWAFYQMVASVAQEPIKDQRGPAGPRRPFNNMATNRIIGQLSNELADHDEYWWATFIRELESCIVEVLAARSFYQDQARSLNQTLEARCNDLTRVLLREQFDLQDHPLILTPVDVGRCIGEIEDSLGGQFTLFTVSNTLRGARWPDPGLPMATDRLWIVVGKLTSLLFKLAYFEKLFSFGLGRRYSPTDLKDLQWRIRRDLRDVWAYKHELSMLSLVVPRWVLYDVVHVLGHWSASPILPPPSAPHPPPGTLEAWPHLYNLDKSDEEDSSDSTVSNEPNRPRTPLITKETSSEKDSELDSTDEEPYRPKLPVDFTFFKGWEASKVNPPWHPYPTRKLRFDVLEIWLVVKDLNGQLDTWEHNDRLMRKYLNKAERGILKNLITLPGGTPWEEPLRKLLFRIGQCWGVHGLYCLVPGALPPLASTPRPPPSAAVGLPYHLGVLSQEVVHTCLQVVYHCLMGQRGLTEFPSFGPEDSGPWAHRRFSYAIRRIGTVVARLKDLLFHKAFLATFGGHLWYPLMDRFGRPQPVTEKALAKRALAYEHELSLLSSSVPRWVIAGLVSQLNLEVYSHP